MSEITLKCQGAEALSLGSSQRRRKLTLIAGLILRKSFFFFYHSWGTFRKLINFISGWKTSEIRAILSSLWRFSCPSCLCSLPLPPPSSPLPCQEQPFASLFFPGSKNPSPPKRAFSWSIAASNNSSNFFNNINRSYPERYANIYCLEIWSSAFLSKQVWYVRVCVCFSNFFPFTRG